MGKTKFNDQKMSSCCYVIIKLRSTVKGVTRAGIHEVPALVMSFKIVFYSLRTSFNLSR